MQLVLSFKEEACTSQQDLLWSIQLIDVGQSFPTPQFPPAALGTTLKKSPSPCWFCIGKAASLHQGMMSNFHAMELQDTVLIMTEQAQKETVPWSCANYSLCTWKETFPVFFYSLLYRSHYWPWGDSGRCEWKRGYETTLCQCDEGHAHERGHCECDLWRKKCTW